MGRYVMRTTIAGVSGHGPRASSTMLHLRAIPHHRENLEKP